MLLHPLDCAESLAGGLTGPLFFALLTDRSTMNEKLQDTILNLALPLIKSQGLELWGLDITPGPTMRVALYVDTKAGSDSGADIEQCETISRQLSAAMDVEDCIDQPWTLEVSTPGLERKFFQFDQLSPYVGDILEIRLNAPIQGTNRKRWLGRLKHLGDMTLSIEPVSISGEGEIRADSGQDINIEWQNVARAQRVHIFTAPPKPGKGTSSRKKQEARK